MDVLKFLNQASWKYYLTHEGVNIKAPTKADANRFAEIYADSLLATAMKLRGRVRIGWRRCKRPIEFQGWMAIQPAPHETALAILM